MAWTIVQDSGVKKLDQDHIQEIVLSLNGEIFKIKIRHNAYDFQSSATLSVLNHEKAWTEIARRNPHNDYNTGVSYIRKPKQNQFQPIITELKSIAEKLQEAQKPTSRKLELED